MQISPDYPLLFATTEWYDTIAFLDGTIANYRELVDDNLVADDEGQTF